LNLPTKTHHARVLESTSFLASVPDAGRFRRSITAAARIAILAVFVCDTLLSARTELKPGVNLFSTQQDITLGRQVQQTVDQQVHLVNDADLTRYISNLGRKLAGFAPGNKYPFTFKVVRDKNINAFALPGGPVYVNTGTIEQAENESQLAGVLAHEIGHVVLRHSTNAMSKALAARGVLALVGGLMGEDVKALSGAGLDSVFLKYSRDNEREADLMGAQILYDSRQYDPQEVARFFEKLERSARSEPMEFLSDHPSPGNRVQLVSDEVASLGPPHRAASREDSEFARMRQIAAEIDRGIPGDSPRHTASADGDSSRELKNFNGRGFRVSYPGKWQVNEDGSTVTIAPTAGRRSQGISQGAIISFITPEEDRQGKVTLESAMRQLVDQIRKDNGGVRVNGDWRRLTVGGLDGNSVTLTGPSPDGGNEVDWLVAALRSDGELWYIVMIAQERDYARVRPVFQQIVDSVRLAN
jgi:Zn-dependent protease with chaperone function